MQFGELIGSLLAAGNTDDLIAWQKLPKRLESAPPGLTDLQRVGLTLRFANGEALTVAQWAQLVGGFAIRAEPVERDVVASLPASLRDETRSALDAIHDRPTREVSAIVQRVAEHAGVSVVIVPSWRSGHRVDRIIPRNVLGALAFGLWLALDPSGPYRAQLARCEFSECRRHFFEHRPEGGKGAPVRRYCCAAHSVGGDREKARERMRQRRRNAQ